MTKKSKKKSKKIKKVEEKLEEQPKMQNDKKSRSIPFEIFCNIKKIQWDHRPGMASYNGALKLKMSLKEWEDHFKDY